MFYALLLLSSTFLLFGFDDNPSELNSIGTVLPLRVPPIAHDDGFLPKVHIISYLLEVVLMM